MCSMCLSFCCFFERVLKRYRLSLDFTHTQILDMFIVKEHLKRTQHKVRAAERLCDWPRDRRDVQTHRFSSVHERSANNINSPFSRRYSFDVWIHLMFGREEIELLISHLN